MDWHKGEGNMLIQLKESFKLPKEEIFSYFSSPKEWTSLYGSAGKVEDYGDGWYAIPLKDFPFPMIAKNIECVPNENVKWEFKGFWKGGGEINLIEFENEVFLEGYEKVSVRWLYFLSPIVEKLFLKKRFNHIWELGWRRLWKRQA